MLLYGVSSADLRRPAMKAGNYSGVIWLSVSTKSRKAGLGAGRCPARVIAQGDISMTLAALAGASAAALAARSSGVPFFDRRGLRECPGPSALRSSWSCRGEAA